MPEPRKRLLSRTVHQVLSTAVDEPNARVYLSRPLYGSARAGLLLHLMNESLVHVKNWHYAGPRAAAGAVIGTITEHGRWVYRRGYL